MVVLIVEEEDAEMAQAEVEGQLNDMIATNSSNSILECEVSDVEEVELEEEKETEF